MDRPTVPPTQHPTPSLRRDPVGEAKPQQIATTPLTPLRGTWVGTLGSRGVEHERFAGRMPRDIKQNYPTTFARRIFSLMLPATHGSPTATLDELNHLGVWWRDQVCGRMGSHAYIGTKTVVTEHYSPLAKPART